MVIINGMRTVFSDDPFNTQILAILYFFVGCVALACNLFNVFIFYSLQRSSKKSFKLFIALEIGEIVNGIAYISTGAGRYGTFVTNVLFNPISTFGCFLYRPWCVLLLLGTQIPAALIMISVIERLTAVYRPSTYQRIWDEEFKTKAICLVFLLELVSLALAAWSAWNETIQNSTSHCPATACVSALYGNFHFVFTVLSFSISFISLAIVYISKRQMIKSKGGQEYFLSTMMITGMCVVVMGLPAGVSLANAWDLWQADDIIFGVAICMPGLISMATTLTNGLFHKDYRKKILSIRKKGSTKDGDKERHTAYPTTQIHSSSQRKSTLTTTAALSTQAEPIT